MKQKGKIKTAKKINDGITVLKSEKYNKKLSTWVNEINRPKIKEFLRAYTRARLNSDKEEIRNSWIKIIETFKGDVEKGLTEKNEEKREKAIKFIDYNILFYHGFLRKKEFIKGWDAALHNSVNTTKTISTHEVIHYIDNSTNKKCKELTIAPSDKELGDNKYLNNQSFLTGYSAQRLREFIQNHGKRSSLKSNEYNNICTHPHFRLIKKYLIDHKLIDGKGNFEYEPILQVEFLIKLKNRGYFEIPQKRNSRILEKIADQLFLNPVSNPTISKYLRAEGTQFKALKEAQNIFTEIPEIPSLGIV